MGGEGREGQPYEGLVGSTATVTRSVTDADTATALGSGDVPVLATPRLLAWFEAATVEALARLPETLTSVGVRVAVDHLRATPVGATVVAAAVVVAVDGRQVVCEVEAHDDTADPRPTIGRGQVLRAVVDREQFLARAARAARPGPPAS